MTRRRTAPAIVLSVLALGAAAALAGAAAAPENGRIAFVRFDLGSGVQPSALFVTNSDGSGEQRITQPPAGYQDDAPDWSPDGSRIVFQRCGPGGGACLVWSANPDGSGAERLSPPCPTGQSLPKCVDDRGPVYSPNGTHIAFVRTTRRPVVMVAGARLGRARPVAGLASFRGRPYAVAWSPNGRQLVFASVGDKGQALYLVPTKGKGVRRLTPLALEAGGRPDWSPDGKRILFHSYASRLGGVGVNLYTIRPDGTGLVQLTHFQDSERVLGGAYSPDGTSVVFSTTARVTDPTAGLPDIAVMRADGTGVKPVTRSQNWDTSPDWGPRR